MEVGYCSDTSHDVKTLAKQDQHAQLMEILRAQGYKATLTTLTLGTTGTITRATYQHVRDLGGDHQPTMLLLNKLHSHSVTCLGHITSDRRKRGGAPDPG